jgi:hypothetical protein
VLIECWNDQRKVVPALDQPHRGGTQSDQRILFSIHATCRGTASKLLQQIMVIEPQPNRQAGKQPVPVPPDPKTSLRRDEPREKIAPIALKP